MAERHKKTSAPGPDTARGAGHRVCAVVVSYYPDEHFGERVRALRSQVDALIVVDNTPGGATSWQDGPAEQEGAGIDVITNQANLGIAKGLNQGLEYALDHGCRWLLTLDQDTHCYPDMVVALLDAALHCEGNPAVVGGNYFDAKRGRHEVGVDSSRACLERKTVITSGCLVDAGFTHDIGGFREDYFIDQVDHEYCLRVRAHGRRVAITRRPVMEHSVGGHTGPQVPLLGQRLPDHPALRKYYITRNSLTTVREYWLQEPIWCLKRLTKLFLGLGSMLMLENDKNLKLEAFVAGFRDGLARRMGVCPHARLNPQ